MKAHGNFRSIQLENNFNLTDQAVIREAESLFSTMAAVEGMPDGEYDADHLKAIHKHLLGDMYPWAGEFRTTSLMVGDGYSKTNTPAPLIGPELNRVLSRLKLEDVSALKPAEFAERIAVYYTQLYALSPFPDGNARAARYLLDQFADAQEMQIKWKDIPAEAFHAATTKALNGNIAPIKALFQGVTDYKDLFDHYGVDAVAQKMGEIAEKAGLRQELSPTTLQRADSQNLKDLAAFTKLLLKADLELYGIGQASKDWDRTSIEHEANNVVDKNSGSEQLRAALDHFEKMAQPPTPRMRSPGF